MAAPGMSVHHQSSKAFSKIEFRPPKPQNEFLWVNVEGQNLRSKVKIEHKSSFIASKTHRLRKAKQLQNLRDSMQPLPTHRHEIPSTDRDSCDSNGDPTRSVVDRALGIGLQEAFPLFTVSTNVSLDYYFQYYRVYTSRSYFPLCPARMVMLCTHISKDLPMLMLVVLTMAASSRATSIVPGSLSEAEVKRHAAQDSLALKAQVLRSLKGAIEEGSGSDKEALLWLIVLLGGLETGDGNIEAATAHARGLKVIVDMLGGLDDLPHTTISLILFIDALTFMTSNAPAIFDIPPQWEKEVLTDSYLPARNNHLSKHTLLGAGFFISPWSDIIPPDLADIIQSLRHLIPCHEQKIKLRNQSVLTDNDHLIFVTWQLSATHLKAHLNPFQETIRISLCIYITTRIWFFGRKPCTINLVRMLRESLDGCLGLFKTVAPDLLFWIFFLCCFASLGSGEFAWAAQGLKKCAEQLSIFEWSSALTILKKFFFVLREGDLAKIVWDEMQIVRMKTAISGSGKSCQIIQDRP